MFDVQNYGAVGDGTTDDTASFVSAINAANAADTGLIPATLYLPDGCYRVTPGSLPTVKCNVHGPGAALFANSTASAAILQFDDQAHGRSVELCAIVGPGFLTNWQDPAHQTGIGLQVLRGEHSRFKVLKVEGLNVGIDFAGHVNGTHIGECSVEVQSIMHCNYGVNVQAGASQVEANRFTIGYLMNVGTNFFLSNHGSGAYSLCCNNHFDVLVMEVNRPNSTGFLLNGDVPGQTKANTFLVRENLAPHPTATVINAPNVGVNYWRLSHYDFTKINASAQNFDLSSQFVAGSTGLEHKAFTFTMPNDSSGAWQDSGTSIDIPLASIRAIGGAVSDGTNRIALGNGQYSERWAVYITPALRIMVANNVAVFANKSASIVVSYV